MDDDASEWVDAPPTPVPASGAWRPGDHPGERKFLRIGDLPLESDPIGVLPDVTLAYETWGELNDARDNAIYVSHALSGDSHAYGHAGPGHLTGGWWNSLVGPGRPLDPTRHFIVSANVVGGCQGTTGPAHPHPMDGRPWGSRFPWPTLRDMVAAEVRLTDALGIDAWQLMLGPSMGGMRTLEWAAQHPTRVRSIAAVGTTAATTAEQIAWGAAQGAAIRADARFAGGDYYDAPDGEGPHVGLGIARMIAHTTYRSEPELHARFGRTVQVESTAQVDDVGVTGDVLRGPGQPGSGQYAIESYLSHHADKLARRFDANTYLRIVHAINTHDVGRGRGGIAAALAGFTAPALVAAVDSDRLYPLSHSQELADALPGCDGVDLLHSDVGHDGFLVESAALNALIEGLLARVETARR
ncbi:homoserine O-acetyltransferase [Demequina sp.]|uniref:homoserine O-acetyltransferase MetX n=1 Tax=Demequina sp. TaxID=2050685 RepID=UPI0025B8AAE0|nr:homoserine O-acetyltransferase [Demequina sp.]